MVVNTAKIPCDKSDQVRGQGDVVWTTAHLPVDFLLQGADKPGSHQWKLVQFPSKIVPPLHPLPHKAGNYPNVKDI